MAASRAGTGRPYVSVRRQQQAQLTRQRVLAAATRLFLAQGYAATTMRGIAAEAGVSVGTVEGLLRTKARALKAAVDVAIAGDDEAVPMLHREWTARALAAGTPNELLEVVSFVITASQHRSAGLVLAVFEGGQADQDLRAVSAEMVNQRHGTASWVVQAMTRVARLHADLTELDAVETLWVLMDPAVYVRLTRDRGWDDERYRSWFARSVGRLIVDHPEPTQPSPEGGQP